MTKAGTASPKTTIPEYLIYELLDGQPIYYQGYKKVLNKTKKLEDIIGSSGLQAEIIRYLMNFFLLNIGLKNYRIYTNEVGGYIKQGENLSIDIAIYDKKVLTSDKVNRKYTNVPPLVVIELLDGHSFNIGQYLREEGIDPDAE